MLGLAQVGSAIFQSCFHLSNFHVLWLVQARDAKQSDLLKDYYYKSCNWGIVEGYLPDIDIEHDDDDDDGGGDDNAAEGEERKELRLRRGRAGGKKMGRLRGCRSAHDARGELRKQIKDMFDAMPTFGTSPPELAQERKEV